MNVTRPTALCLTMLIVPLSGCVRPPELSPSTKAEIEASVDRKKARQLSGAIVDDLLKDSRIDLRVRMEKGMRDYYDDKSFGSIVDQMFTVYGKPLEAEYKMDEAGWKTGSGGYSKPMRKFWYAVRTSKHERGSHYLTIEIVPDGGGLAGSSFAIVTFPLGAPPSLR